MLYNRSFLLKNLVKCNTLITKEEKIIEIKEIQKKIKREKEKRKENKNSSYRPTNKSEAYLVPH